MASRNKYKIKASAYWEDGNIVIDIDTNLPEGTKLVVTFARGGDSFYYDVTTAKVVDEKVIADSYEYDPEGPPIFAEYDIDGKRHYGNYDLAIQGFPLYYQPEEIQADLAYAGSSCMDALFALRVGDVIEIKRENDFQFDDVADHCASRTFTRNAVSDDIREHTPLEEDDDEDDEEDYSGY